MKSMKLLAVSVMCVAGAAGLAMVGAGEAGKPEAASQPAKKVRIGVSVPAADHGWTAGIGWWAKRAMDLYPDVEWQFQTASDPAKQTKDIEAMITKGVDGLVILATQSEAMTPVAERAHDRGVFIVNVDRGFTKPVADIFLEGDNKAFGRKSAQFVAEKMGGKGNLVILQGIAGVTVNTDRINAFMDVMKAYPDIKVLDSQPADWNREKGLKVMKTFLTKHPKIDAVWAQDDDIMLGAIQAIKEAGREKEMWILGGAGMKDAIKMVMDKSVMVPADVTYPPSMIAAGIQTAVGVLRDGKKDRVMEFMPRHVLIDIEMVTPENAKKFYFPDSVY